MIGKHNVMDMFWKYMLTQRIFESSIIFYILKGIVSVIYIILTIEI